VKTPDITPAQIAAAVAAVLSACVVLFKLDISDGEQASLVTALGVFLAVAWQIADSIVRHGRSKKAAAEANLAAAQTTAWAQAGGDAVQIPPAA